MNDEQYNIKPKQSTTATWDKFIQFTQLLFGFLKELQISRQGIDKNGNPYTFKIGEQTNEN